MQKTTENERKPAPPPPKGCKKFRLVGDFDGDAFRDCVLSFAQANNFCGRAQAESDGSLTLLVVGDVEIAAKTEQLRQRLTADFNLLSMTELLIEEEVGEFAEFTFLA